MTTHRIVPRGVLLAFATAMMMDLSGHAAMASNITFADIALHEYDLSVSYTAPSFTLIQYGYVNGGDPAFNSNRDIVRGSGDTLMVGDTKFMLYYKIPGLPKVGFALEAIVPEIGMSGPGTGHGIGGIGDTNWGYLAWIKPTSNITIGFQDYFSAPIGTSETTNGYFANNVGFFYDAEWQNLSLTGDVGMVNRTTQNLSEMPQARVGNTYFANARIGYLNPTMVEPFVGFDWQSAGPTRLVSDGLETTPSSDELAVDGGFFIKFTKKISLAIFYNRSVEGRNTDFTNAGYLRLISAF